MTGRERLDCALHFREGDRVPIEVWLPKHLEHHPKAQPLKQLIEEYADNFKGIGLEQGLMGLKSKVEEEELPSEAGYMRKKITHYTSAGEFTGILVTDPQNPAYSGWEKHFISDYETFQRFANAEFEPLEFRSDYMQRLEDECGQRSYPIIGLYHPFGAMARNAHPEDFYPWLYTDADLVHQLFEKQYRQLRDLVDRLQPNCVVGFVALEMAVPPWMGEKQFDEFIYAYDKPLYDRIHVHGGLVRHHAHDKVFSFLNRWSEMGINSIEPLEMPPYGDTDLAKAKELVGDRMSLGGNIPSQNFITMEHEEIALLVKNACEAAMAGGGFILKGASSVCGLNSYKNEEQLERLLSATECMIRSGLQYGIY